MRTSRADGNGDEDVSKKRRTRLIVLSFFFKRSRTKFVFRWKVVYGVNCFKIFKKAEKSIPSSSFLVNFQTRKFDFVWICLPFDLLTANNFKSVKSVKF